MKAALKRMAEEKPRLRLIAKTENGNKVYRDLDWEEYRVVFPDGGTFHTDDKQDAMSTANSVTIKAYA